MLRHRSPEPGSAELDELTLLRRAVPGVRTAAGLLAGSAPWRAGTLVLLDIDAMHAVNRRFGAHVGDLLLAGVETALREATAGRGDVTPFGGDQFLVLLRGGHSPGPVVRELTRAVRRVRIGRAHVTASAGLASWSGDRPVPAALLGTAARLLRSAKSARSHR